MTVTRPQGVGYRARRLRNYLTDLWGRREFAWYLAAGNLKARNASTALGLFWWVLNPMLLGLVYFVVFGLIFGGNRPPDYIAYLLSGMFVFHFTNQSMTGGANSILNNAKLLVNLKFPKMVLLLSAVIESAIGFLASIAVYFVIAITIAGIRPSLSVLWFAVAFPIQVLMNLGLAAIVARLAVPFRDINNLVPYLNRLWLYFSPIIWPLSFLDNAGPVMNTIIRYNPMFDLISVYRTALMGQPFDAKSLVLAAIWGVGLFLVGAGLFVTYENRMVRYL